MWLQYHVFSNWQAFCDFTIHLDHLNFIELNFICETFQPCQLAASLSGLQALKAAHKQGRTARKLIAFPPKEWSTSVGKYRWDSICLFHILNQGTLSDVPRRFSLCMGIPISSMISLPIMYRPFVIDKNLPHGLELP